MRTSGYGNMRGGGRTVRRSVMETFRVLAKVGHVSQEPQGVDNLFILD